MASAEAVQQEALLPQEELAEATQKQERERSKIDFAYLSLDTAIEIAKAVHATGGTSSQIEQLAAHMNESPNGGSFRNKVVNARNYGLVKHAMGTVTLTSLGSRIVDPEQEKAARVEAFLHVPLNRRIYEEYKGTTLPPTAAALEAAMVAMGVASKQKDKARQAFLRAAGQAGFFAYGTSKLIYPVLNGTGEARTPKGGIEDVGGEREKPKTGDAGSDEGTGKHPLIEGLIRALPKSGENWPLDLRRKWLQAAAMNFDYVYGDTGVSGTIKVTVERENSAN